MKKLFALVALVLGVVSCQSDLDDFGANVGGEQEVIVNVSLPEETRANSALGGITNVIASNEYTIRYIFQVYNSNFTEAKAQQVKYSDGASVSFPVRLVPGRDYNFVVWADIVENANPEDGVKCADLHYNTANLANITLNDTWEAMDETRDAYTVSQLIEDFKGTEGYTLTLKRPLAKLRVITTDMAELLGLDLKNATVTYSNSTPHYNAFNALQSKAIGDTKNRNIEHKNYTIKAYDEDSETNKVLFTDYFFAENDVVKFNMSVAMSDDKTVERSFTTDIHVKRNYLTTLIGDILTEGNNITVKVEEGFAGESGIEDDKTFAKIDTAEELRDAISKGIENIILEGDIDLNDLLTIGTLSTRAATDPSLTIKAGEKINIDLGGFTLSATSSQTGKNYNMIDVRGTLSIKNGAIECKHEGNNMEWNNSTNVFNVTAGGVLNLEGVTAKNLGGSDMAFVAHLNNWGEVTLNVDNSTLESTYVAVRVFNSGNDMNNVTIKNSTLKGVSAAFWVHNYTVADFGSEAKAETQKALLNLNIYDQSNTFIPDVNGIRYGFTNSVRSDVCGITKSVSEDGSIVTLGAILEDAVLRQGVAGYENSTIKKVVVGEGIAVLENRCFRKFHALEEVVLPAGLTTIGVKEKGNNDTTGTGMFQGCENLKTIIIPETVTTIDAGSFYGCSSLETINIPSGVTRIEDSSLRATGLKNIVFHEGVTYFGQYAFRDCENLEEIYINAPSFTIESNTFLNAAAPYPNFTIYVANAEMKAYLESVFDAHTKTFITIVAPNSVASKEDLPVENDKIDTNFDEDVNLYADITVSSKETNANSGYGATGVTVTDGAVLNGQGHTLTVDDAWGTWDCAVAAKGGTIKNLTVSGAMRGIFMPGANGDVYIDNVIFDNVIYTFNSDGGDKNYGVYISNSTLNGWTSHSDVHKEVVYTNCNFGEGNGYAYCRPYGTTAFVGCAFEAGFTLEPLAAVTLENCTIGGVAVTADNLSTFVLKPENVTIK